MVGHAIAQQQHPVGGVVDGAAAVGQDEAGPEEEIPGRGLAELIGLGDPDPAETDAREFLGQGQLAAQGESPGHGLRKQFRMPGEEVVHEASHGLGIIPDALIGLKVQG